MRLRSERLLLLLMLLLLLSHDVGRVEFVHARLRWDHREGEQCGGGAGGEDVLRLRRAFPGRDRVRPTRGRDTRLVKRSRGRYGHGGVRPQTSRSAECWTSWRQVGRGWLSWMLSAGGRKSGRRKQSERGEGERSASLIS